MTVAGVAVAGMLWEAGMLHLAGDVHPTKIKMEKDPPGELAGQEASGGL